MFSWLHFQTPQWQPWPQSWWCFAYVMSPPFPSPPPLPPLKCNYHLADTKMRFLACGHSWCYLKILNFRREGERKRASSLVVLVLGGSRKEGGEGEEKHKREGWRRSESFWEDAIMRTVNSETGCERQRLAASRPMQSTDFLLWMAVREGWGDGIGRPSPTAEQPHF